MSKSIDVYIHKGGYGGGSCLVAILMLGEPYSYIGEALGVLCTLIWAWMRFENIISKFIAFIFFSIPAIFIGALIGLIVKLIVDLFLKYKKKKMERELMDLYSNVHDDAVRQKKLADMEKKYGPDLKDFIAKAILSIPHHAANPYDLEYQMTPEQHLDYQVYCDWVKAGKPTSNKSWSERYSQRN